jgi:hypothetical protein
VPNKATFRIRFKADVGELQKAGYLQMTVHQVELLDQSSIDEYLKSSFTLKELVTAASRVNV